MYKHKPIIIKFSRLILCSECEGLGKISESYEPCIVCNCSGRLSKVIYKYGKEEILSAICFRCNGVGYLFNGDSWCETNCFVCDGIGLNKIITEQTISYQEYMTATNPIKLSGLGNVKRVGENIHIGNLIVDVGELDKTEDLYRNGYDVCIRQYISIFDCMTGGTFTHKHQLTDTEMTIKLCKVADDQGLIKPSMLTQRVKSQGFHDKLSGKMGDLVIEVCIVCPDITDKEIKDNLKRISGESLKSEDAEFEAIV
jgi:DnaJ-class molecular chaperone